MKKYKENMKEYNEICGKYERTLLLYSLWDFEKFRDLPLYTYKLWDLEEFQAFLPYTGYRN